MFPGADPGGPVQYLRNASILLGPRRDRYTQPCHSGITDSDSWLETSAFILRKRLENGKTLLARSKKSGLILCAIRASARGSERSHTLSPRRVRVAGMMHRRGGYVPTEFGLASIRASQVGTASNSNNGSRAAVDRRPLGASVWIRAERGGGTSR